MTISASCSQASLGSMVLRFGSCGVLVSELEMTQLPSEFEMSRFQSVYGEAGSSTDRQSGGCGRRSSRSKELDMVQETKQVAKETAAAAGEDANNGLCDQAKRKRNNTGAKGASSAKKARQ